MDGPLTSNVSSQAAPTRESKQQPMVGVERFKLARNINRLISFSTF
jgi:hypothetical protein